MEHIMKLDEIFVDTGFQLFVDLDGVLADWVGGAERLLQTNWSGDKTQDKDFWKALHTLDYDEVEEHWATLPMLPDGKALWKYVSKFNPIILSAPDKRGGFRQACERGKHRWVKTHLTPSPQTIVTTDKWKYAKPHTILIDDMTKNTIPFEDHGGSAILHDGNARKTILALQERFKFPKR